MKDILYSTLSHLKSQDIKSLLFVAIDKNQEILRLPDKDNKTLIHKLAEISTDEDLMKWMVEKYGKQNVFSDENLLIYEICIKNENLNIFKYFLLEDDLRFNLWKKLLEISFFSEKVEFYEEVEKFGCKKFASKSKEEIEKFKLKFDEISQFRNDIENGFEDKVHKFIKENPKLKICRVKSYLSAIELARDKKRFNIFKILFQNDFELPEVEDRSEDLKFFLDLCFNENIGESKKSKNYHKSLLLSKFSTPENTSMMSHNEIQTMIDELFEYEDVIDVLKTVASSDVEIIFTMSKSDVQDFDPNSKYANGVYYPGKDLMLVAKCNNIVERYGVFVHEAAHCAFDQMYNNICKPYLTEDYNRMRDFRKITNKYFEKSFHSEIKEPIINSVFKNYDESQFEAELAVRPIQLITKVRKENSEKSQSEIDQKIKDLRTENHELFDFHYNQASNDLNIVDGVPLRMLNDHIGLWNQTVSQNLEFKSNQMLFDVLNRKESIKFFSKYPNLVLRCIYEELLSSYSDSLFKIKSKNLFINLKSLYDDELLFEKFMKLSSSETVKKIIINCDFFKISKYTIFMHKLRNISKKKIFINPHPEHDTFFFISCEFSFSWEEKVDQFSLNSKTASTIIYISLSEQSKSDALEIQLKFNSRTTKLSEILNQNDVDEQTINILNELKELNKLRENISINKEKFENYFDERIFLVKQENGNLIDHKVDFLIKRFRNLKKKFIILCDRVGSGKTEALKNIYRNFLMKNNKNEFWILFITQEEICEFNFDQDLGWWENTKSDIEFKVFKKYWNEERIILFVDGVDDLDINQQSKLVQFIQKPNFNQVFITCGLYSEELLKSKLNGSQIISLKPLDTDQKLKMLNEQKIKFDEVDSIPFQMLVNLKDVHNVDKLNLYQIHKIYNKNVFEKYNQMFSKTLPFDCKTIYYYVHFYAALKPFNNLRILKTFGITLKLVGNLKSFVLIDAGKCTFFDTTNSHFWVAKFFKTFLLSDDEIFSDHETLLELLKEVSEDTKYKPIIEMLDNSLIYSPIERKTADRFISILKNKSFLDSHSLSSFRTICLP